MLVSEIVLCIKEVNKRTRIASYELLVELAKAMHEAEPPTLQLGADAHMGKTLPHTSVDTNICIHGSSQVPQS